METLPAEAPAGPDLSHIHPSLRHLAIPIAELTYDPANARLHDEVNLVSIENSLKAFGQDQPIVVQRQGMIVRKGNGRTMAARRLGYTHLACIVVDEDNVTAVARAIADNRTAELGRWDVPTLSKLLKGLAAQGVAPAVVGFTAEEAAKLLLPASPDPAAAPPAAAEPAALTDGLKESRTAVSTAKANTVVQIGEYRFPLDREAYLAWQDEIRQAAGFATADVHAEIRRRLGLDPQQD